MPPPGIFSCIFRTVLVAKKNVANLPKFRQQRAERLQSEEMDPSWSDKPDLQTPVPALLIVSHVPALQK